MAPGEGFIPMDFSFKQRLMQQITEDQIKEFAKQKYTHTTVISDVERYAFEEGFKKAMELLQPPAKKPLSEITDKDAIEVANICLQKPLQIVEILNWDWCKRIVINRQSDIDNDDVIVDMIIHIDYNNQDIMFIWEYNHSKGVNVSERHCPNSLPAYDFLRSKGYILPTQTA